MPHVKGKIFVTAEIKCSNGHFSVMTDIPSFTVM